MKQLKSPKKAGEKMTIHYPKGAASPLHFPKQLPKKQGPVLRKAPTNFANRGMNLEEAINDSNAYYLAKNLAVVHKKPTPLQIVKVDYPKRSAAVIREAYFSQASTTDYNGVFNGYYLDFEAKETKNKTSFPLKNFHQHQIDHFKNCLAQKGICFVLLYFSTLNRCFYLAAEDLIVFWDQQVSGKKSIPLQTIETLATELPEKIAPRIPYLSVIEKMIAQKEAFHE